MDLFIVNQSGNVFLKVLKNIPLQLEDKLKSVLHIKTSMNSIDKNEIWRNTSLRIAIKVFEDDSKRFPYLLAVFQYIDSLAPDDLVILCSFKLTSTDVERCKFAFYIVEQDEDLHNAWKIPFPYEPTGRYNVHLITNVGYKQYVGEQDRSKRECRFCHKHGKKYFKEESHAISAFIGNDFIFCNEECDECNHDTLRKLEQDLDNYYKVTRSLNASLNRDSKKINTKGANFKIDNSGEFPIVTYKGDIDIENIGDEGLELSLEDNTHVNVCNVYKCLVKYVIATIPNNELYAFDKTIDWIMGKLTPRYLPPIYRYERMANIERPELAIFIRKGNKKDIPYCIAHFAFLSNFYIYAIPYCQPYDVGNSMLKEALRNYIKLRKDNWDYTIEDFNSNKKVNIITTRIIYKDNHIEEKTEG